MSTDGDVAVLTYEQALGELDTLIQRLERGAVDLDEAIACYERASRLAQHCADLLDRTEQKITQLVVGPAGPQERAFSPEAVPASAPAAPSGAAAAAGGPGPVPSPAGGAGGPGPVPSPAGGGPGRAFAPPPPLTVPPPASAPVRARPVRTAPTPPAPGPDAEPALPGLEPPPAPRRESDADIDLDDIPF